MRAYAHGPSMPGTYHVGVLRTRVLYGKSTPHEAVGEQHMTRKLLTCRLLVLVLVIVLFGECFAQATNTSAAAKAEITGVVADQQGAVLPDATVLLLSQAVRLQDRKSVV